MPDNRIPQEFSDEEDPLEIRESYGKAKSGMTHQTAQYYKLEARHQAIRVTGTRKQSKLCPGYRPKIHSKKKKEEYRKKKKNKKKDDISEVDLEKRIAWSWGI